MSALRALTMSVAIASLLLACGPPPATQTGDEATVAGDERPTDADTAVSSDPDAVSEAMSAALAFIAEVHDPDSPVFDEATFETWFADSFRDQVSLAQMRPLVDSMRDDGPYELFCTNVKDEHHVVAQYRATDGEAGFAARLRVDPAKQTIVGLRLFPAPWIVGEPPDSWAAMTTSLDDVGERVTLFAAEVGEDGSLTPIHASNADAIMPIGSAFKLWVLHRLAEDVDAGLRTWDEPLVMTDDRRVFSSVELDRIEDGDELPLEDAAAAMIRSSDNTATDMLIDLLEPERVEATVGALDVSTHGQNTPFLRTRDMFWLKLQADDETRASFTSGDLETRRAIVERVDEEWDLGVAAWASLSWQTPRQVDEIEWFATAEDLARTLVALRDRFDTTESGETVAKILSYNAGIESCGGWRFIGFKGGSEPGVINLSFLAERDDGRWFVLVLGAMSQTELLEDSEVISLAWHALDRLSDHP